MELLFARYHICPGEKQPPETQVKFCKDRTNIFLFLNLTYEAHFLHFL